MSDSEKFLGRWSRRKQKAAKLAKEAAVDASKQAPAEDLALEKEADKSAVPVKPAKEMAKAFDVSSLPPIDSITATTDIRPFLAPGVPAELTRAALRKAWRSDPAIRDFVGLSENSWDFNDPTGMHGFGPLQLTDELKQIAMQMLSVRDPGEKSQQPEGPGNASERKVVATSQNAVEDEREGRVVDAKYGGEKNILSSKDTSALQQASYDDVATQREKRPQEKDDFKPKTRHGSALPHK